MPGYDAENFDPPAPVAHVTEVGGFTEVFNPNYSIHSSKLKGERRKDKELKVIR
jgi:hypothetical protein